jgi:hypothetical protein
MRTYWGNGGTAPRILNIGTREKWVVSFTLQTLYVLGIISSRYPLGVRLGGPQSRAGRCDEEEKPYHCPLDRAACSLVCILTDWLTDWANQAHAELFQMFVSGMEGAQDEATKCTHCRRYVVDL